MESVNQDMKDKIKQETKMQESCLRGRDRKAAVMIWQEKFIRKCNLAFAEYKTAVEAVKNKRKSL